MTSLTDETTGAVFGSPGHQAKVAELYRDFDAEGMTPLWRTREGLMPVRPEPRAVPDGISSPTSTATPGRWAQAPMRALTLLLGEFGVAETTARVLLSRMRREGWFTSSRDGLQTSYALTARSIKLLDEGRTRIFDRGRDGWNGTWRMVIYAVPEDSRAERDRVRRTLTWHGFGPLATATWISPHPRLDTVREALADLSATRIDLLESRALSRAADREMAFRCWDLDGLARDYMELVATYEQLPSDAELAALPGPEALRRQVELVASYRALPFRDPDLPAALLPEGWQGRRAHALFTAAHDALHGPADAYARDVVARNR